MIKVNQVYSFSEIGKRENNEDFVGFEGASLFVVCDGVGGNEKGEVASALVGKCFLQEFKKLPDSDASKVLKKAEAELSAYILKHPETQGMATTLTFSQIRNNGIYIAWCGDSRIYQFRDGKIIFQTEDHSWVNEALKSGIITKEEAIGHPKSNIITRAISATERPTKIDDILIEDVRKSDFIFHCSDGVLEAWSDQDLEALFGQGFSIQEILEKLKSECKKLSRDNATALLYQVEMVEGLPETGHLSLKTDQLENLHLPGRQKINPIRKSGFILLVFLLFVLIGYLVLRGKREDTTPQFKYDKPKSKNEKVIVSSKASERLKVDSSMNSQENDTGKDLMAKEKITPIENDTTGPKKAKSVNP